MRFVTYVHHRRLAVLIELHLPRPLDSDKMQYVPGVVLIARAGTSWEVAFVQASGEVAASDVRALQTENGPFWWILSSPFLNSVQNKRSSAAHV